MLDAIDKLLIHEISCNLPIEKEPYKEIGEKLQINEEEVIKRLQKLKDNGYLKRVGGLVRYKKLGFNVNALVVWNVSKDNITNVGEHLASLHEISHCYERYCNKNWDYNLYTMVHGKTNKQLNKLVKGISKNIELYDYIILYTVKELKKSSINYIDLLDMKKN
jgi:DNA-binding Lrp family transcriptional regulator